MIALDLIVQKVEELEGWPVQVGERDTNIVRYRIGVLVGVKLYRGDPRFQHSLAPHLGRWANGGV